MTKNSLFLFSMVILFFSCNSKEDKEKYNHVTYRAIHNKDTAILSIHINDKKFYGRYEISHYKIGKDSGNVRGNIKGDTLRGDFHYITFGGGWKRIPLALLKKDKKLVLGNGVIGSYMNLPLFVPEIPIEYDNSGFVFEKIK